MVAGAPYRDVLTQGILQLTETAVIDKLREKWWPENQACDRTEDEDKDKLGLSNVGGVFVLLILGGSLSFSVSVLEFLWNVRKVAVREKVRGISGPLGITVKVCNVAIVPCCSRLYCRKLSGSS